MAAGFDFNSFIGILELNRWLSTSWLLSVLFVSEYADMSLWFIRKFLPAFGSSTCFNFGGSIVLLAFVPFIYMYCCCCCFWREFCFAVIFAFSSAEIVLVVDFVNSGDWLGSVDLDPLVLCSLASAFVIFSCFFPVFNEKIF